MPLSPRDELLAIQKKLFRTNRRLINESVIVQESDFQSYEKTYKRFVRNYKRISSIDEMLKAYLNADIVYVGDYHTCNQSQRSFLRILKEQVRRRKNFVIGLELLEKKHQKWIDSFLSGKISEATFLKKVSLKKRWIFDLWENFKPFFDFARYHNIPVFGIDAAPPRANIRARDRAAAQWTAQIIKTHSNKKIFILIGDLHIAPSHLPKGVKEALKKYKIKKTDLILYQNSESIYWKLAEKHLEHDVEVVQTASNSFCRMHTPPVICQRSYLNWLEHEEGELDYSDAKHQFTELVDRISHFLKIPLDKETEKVEVYTCGDLSFLEKIKKSKKFKPEEIKLIKNQIITSESYYIPKMRVVYLSNLSLNHAGEEAAHFMKHICSGEEKSRDIFDAFYANILHEALGFFGSKLINHKRKCYHERDYFKLIQFFQTMKAPSKRHLEYETALLVYQSKKMEQRSEAFCDMDLLKSRHDLFFTVTHALGYMLGDILYYALLEGTVTKTEIRHLFLDPWKGDGKPFQTYWTLIQKIKNVKIPKRM